MLHCLDIPAAPLDALLRDWERLGAETGWPLLREWLAGKAPRMAELAAGLEALAAGGPALAEYGPQSAADLRQLALCAEVRPEPEAWRGMFERQFAIIMGHQIPGAGVLSMDWHEEFADLWSFLHRRGFVPADDFRSRLGRLIDLRKPYRLLIVIPARGGSKGVPRKALQPIGGRPLISYTIESALAVPGVDHVVVSTDDPEIRDLALQHGAEAPFLRPPGISGDHSPLEAVYAHCLGWYRSEQDFKPDIFGVLSPTHPFRRPGLLEHVLRQALADPEIMTANAVSPVPHDPQNCWTLAENACQAHHLPVRGNAGPVFLSSFSFAFSFLSRFTNAHRPPRTATHRLNEAEAIDIDTPFDYLRACAVLEAGLYPLEPYV